MLMRSNDFSYVKTVPCDELTPSAWVGCASESRCGQGKSVATATHRVSASGTGRESLESLLNSTSSRTVHSGLMAIEDSRVRWFYGDDVRRTKGRGKGDCQSGCPALSTLTDPEQIN